MPVAAIIATQLTDASVRIYSITQGGMDVLRQPGTPGNLYGVPLETVAVTEAGPGGVSTMTYTIEDPSGTVPVPPSGTDVQFWDIASNHPEFSGWVQSVSVRPWPPLGRYLDVRCIGVEAQLDWPIISASLPSGLTVGTAWQSLAASTSLRVGIAAGGSEGTQDNPIAGTIAGRTIAAATLTNVTLRDAIASVWTLVSIPPVDGTLFVTVDFYDGLRIWHNGTTNLRPDDYISLSLLDTTAGSFAAENASYDLVYGDIVRNVKVIGSSDFGTFSDGSGKPGSTALLTDSTITTAGQAQSAAQQYMQDRALAVRGSLVLTDFDEGATAIRTGSNLVLTDAQLGFPGGSPGTFPIGQIDKTYEGNGRENWKVTFGGQSPSATRVFRHLTRGTLS